MSAEQIGKPVRYFNSIDGLRLLASVNVVLFHFAGIGGLYDLGGNPGWFFRILKGPAFHASLFFVLGGFIFTTKFAPKLASFNSWDFLKKRFGELYPLHFFMTLMMAALYIIKRWGTDGIDIPKLGYSLLMHLSFLWSFWPQGSFTLNTPSWALSAMFLCYVVFGPLLKWAMSIKTRASVMGWMLVCFMPLAAWGYYFVAIGSPNPYYQLFHGFAPVRFFEFVQGVLLARFFMLRGEEGYPKLYGWISSKVLNNKDALAGGSLTGKIHHHFMSIRGDMIMLLMFYLISLCISPQFRNTPAMKWFSYHVFLVPVYMMMIYMMSIEKGWFAKFFAISFVRKMGRTSFYPYLIHIPLMSAVTLFCEMVLGYKKFLHDPVNIIVFMTVLYGGGYLYVYAFRNKRRAKIILEK